jgi:hypothetical protein
MNQSYAYAFCLSVENKRYYYYYYYYYNILILQFLEMLLQYWAFQRCTA